MKYLILVLLISGCATIKEGPQEDGSVMFNLPKEVVEQCENEGGCALVSEAFLRQYAEQFALGMCGKSI